jgi:uncharacterized protein (TIGR02246 family)
MRRLSLFPVLPLLALVAIGCQPPAQEMAPLRTAQQVQVDINALRATWQELANAGDASGVAALYADDALYVDQYGGVHEGRAAIEGYFGQSLTRSSGYEIVTQGTVIQGDMVAAYGTFSGTLTGPEGAMPTGGMWQAVSVYQPDGSLKLRLHFAMIPAPAPAM